MIYRLTPDGAGVFFRVTAGKAIWNHWRCLPYVTERKSAIVMSLDHIKSLLQLSCTFNFSSISHSFSIGLEDTLTVKCLKNTFILEVTSSKTQQIEYFTSIDQAAEALYKRIRTDKTD